MVYRPQWERLSDAAARIAALGKIPVAQAKELLCSAIADRVVETRVEVSEVGDWRGALLLGNSVGPPAHIQSKDMDWEQSRPLGKWACGPYPRHLDWDRRDIGLVEVRTADLEDAFGGGLEISPTISAPDEKSSDATDSLEDEYRKYVALHKSDNPHPDRDDDVAHMRSIFEGIDRSVVLKLRRDFAPEHWKKGGRRPVKKKD